MKLVPAKARVAGLCAAALVTCATASALAEGGDKKTSTASADGREHWGVPVGDFVFRPFIEARVRGEYRRNPINEGIYGEHAILSIGMPTTDREPYEDQALVWERIRLGLEIDWGPLTAHASFQDVRMFGDPARQGGSISGQPELPVTGPFQAYLEIHTVDRGVYFRLGRQSMLIGDGRLIGISDDRAPGRTLDAARIFGRIGDFDLQAFAAMLVFPGEPTVPDVNGDKPRLAAGAQLYGLDATWHVAPFFGAELTGLARVVRQPLVTYLTPSDTFVAAARVFGDYRGVRYSVMGAFEGGRVAPEGNVENATLIAGAVAGRVEWETALPWHITVGAQGAYASGDPAEGDQPTEIGVFDPILPDSTKHFGQYDFYALSNLIEAGGDVAIKPVDAFTSRIGYRFAALANAKGPWHTGALFPIGQSSTNTDQMLGHVLQVSMEGRPWEPLRIAAHYGLMVLGDGAKQIFLDTHEGLPEERAPDFAEFFGVDIALELP